MKSKTRAGTLLALLALALAATSAHADWNPGFKHKMHFPQQPDAVGFDVNFRTPMTVADDWKCSETGPVTDVHFWFSARHDWLNLQLPLDAQIFNIHVSIHADVPAGPVIPFSHPGQELWARDFNVGQVKIRKYGSGQQSWYDPATGLLIPNDHTTIYQCNIINIPEAFVQKRGTIYWLDVSISSQQELGWKSADLFKYPPANYGQHFLDDATWTLGAAVGWTDIHYPAGQLQGQSMDMAFVITGFKRPFNHKMHFPQQPDPTGADVNFTFPRVAADDWRCSETGPVDDIHFWFSAFNDWFDIAAPIGQQIFNIHLSIHADIPDPDGPGPLFSQPGVLLWQRDIPGGAANIRVAKYFTEGQAWYDPTQGYVPLNHRFLYRCDIDSIPQPFPQQQGTIYWLDVSIASEQPLGWKTADVDGYPPPFTGNHFQDDAVWGNFPAPIWTDLKWPPGLPNSGKSIDLAFVITRLPGSPTGVGGTPKSYHLEQNFPNPFNPTTTIRYSLPEDADIELAVFGVDGKLIRVLENEAKPAGTFEAIWDGRDAFGNSVASGVYFYRLQAGAFTETKKMVLMK